MSRHGCRRRKTYFLNSASYEMVAGATGFRRLIIHLRAALLMKTTPFW
ncbi:hypothetical protein KCP75_04730 [Salmonella enterica subsp. enterica]|nr:hypothetical protein KCP75_04730 [Salmonella enterica subsp. enterica]